MKRVLPADTELTKEGMRAHVLEYHDDVVVDKGLSWHVIHDKMHRGGWTSPKMAHPHSHKESA